MAFMSKWNRAGRESSAPSARTKKYGGKHVEVVGYIPPATQGGLHKIELIVNPKSMRKSK
ncbi:hypothetical protein [Paenibacillus koleovorans]|uniref:hypothetical protein n=1 Tax=Paenibacillus koleovorans TaxID=121608 RepID=UPI000FDB81FA|nr:hypothetical protein [Paenibacillus koleovorans]